MASTQIERDNDEESRRVVCAVELGWRVAYLYADLEHPLHRAQDPATAPACLPAVESLPNSDQLELHVRAAASLAGRLHLDAQAEIAALASTAHAAARRPQRSAEVRERIHVLHTALLKDLWARREGEGKAYELGSSLFDTWNRLRQASEQGPERMRDAWVAVFEQTRIERIKTLLDDLQTRLDPAAVEVVKDHLDGWSERVRDARAKDKGGARLPVGGDALAVLRKQALIWRQLVTRDKEPEAYLQPKDRARVRREFNKLMWRSLVRMRTFVGALLCAAVVYALYKKVFDPSTVTRTLLPILGALGVTQASLIVLARRRLDVWAGLLWNRALTGVVFDVTYCADEAFSSAGRRGTLAVPAKAALDRLHGRSVRATAFSRRRGAVAPPAPLP